MFIEVINSCALSPHLMHHIAGVTVDEGHDLGHVLGHARLVQLEQHELLSVEVWMCEGGSVDDVRKFQLGEHELPQRESDACVEGERFRRVHLKQALTLPCAQSCSLWPA